MKQTLMIVPAIGLLAAVSVTAQDSAADAAEAVAEAAEQAAEAVEETYPDPPPPVIVADTEPLEARRVRYPTEPRVKNWRDARPAPADYPIASWQAGEEGTVGYDISVDVEGKPTKCMVMVSSGYAALDAKTCEVVMERAEFDPALEAEDVPIAGTYSGHYNWRKQEPEMPNMAVTFRYLHGADGKSSECEFLRIEGDLPEEMRREIEKAEAEAEGEDACRGIGNRRGVPYRDENGVPVAKRVTVSFDVVVVDPAQ